jgi:hypothetical protein
MVDLAAAALLGDRREYRESDVARAPGDEKEF